MSRLTRTGGRPESRCCYCRRWVETQPMVGLLERACADCRKLYRRRLAEFRLDCVRPGECAVCGSKRELEPVERGRETAMYCAECASEHRRLVAADDGGVLHRCAQYFQDGLLFRRIR